MALLFIYYTLLSALGIYWQWTFRLFKNRLYLLLLFLFVWAPFLFLQKGIMDIELFESVGYFSANRLDIYYTDADHMLYPYFPLLSLILGAIYKASQILPLGFLTLWRVVTVIALIGTSYMAKSILVKRGDKQAAGKILIFVLSPLALFPVAFHAHPDVILILFYLLGIYLITYGGKYLTLGFLSLGLSVLTKTWSFVFLPLLLLQNFRFSKKILGLCFFLLTIGAVCQFYIRFWHSSIFRLLDAVGGYAGSWVVYWGPQGIVSELFKIPFASNFRLVYTAVIFAAAYFLIIRSRAKIVEGSEFLMLTFFVFTLSWAPQYIFWVWPFIVIVRKIETARLFSIFSLPYVLASYISLVFGLRLNLLITLLSLPVWFLGLGLWLGFARQALGRRNLVKSRP